MIAQTLTLEGEELQLGNHLFVRILETFPTAL